MTFETSGAFPKQTGIIIKVLAEAGKVNMIPFPVTRSTIRDSIAACIQVGNALANKAGLNYWRRLGPRPSKPAPPAKRQRCPAAGAILAARAFSAKKDALLTD